MLLAIYYPELKRLIDRGETTNHNVRRPLPSDTKGMPYVEDGITATIREILTMHYSFAPEDRKEYDLFIAKYASLANLAAEEAESNTFAADYAYVDPKQVRTKVLGLIELLGLSKRNGELARYVEPKVAMRAIDFLFEKCELTEGLLEFGGSCARGFMMPLIDGGLVATQKVRDGKSGKLHAVIDLTAIHPESDLGFIRRASGLTDFSLDLRIGLATTLIALKKEAVAPPEFGASRDIRNDSFVLLSILTSLEYYSVSASAGVNHYQIENGCFFRVGLEKLDLNRCAEALKRLKIFRPWR
jgi:hypothetical protein